MAKKGMRHNLSIDSIDEQANETSKSQIPHHCCTPHLNGLNRLLQDHGAATYPPATEYAQVRSGWWVWCFFCIRLIVDWNALMDSWAAEERSCDDSSSKMLWSGNMKADMTCYSEKEGSVLRTKTWWTRLINLYEISRMPLYNHKETLSNIIFEHSMRELEIWAYLYEHACTINTIV